MRTHKTQTKGFTLIEMLVVIAIIALLAAILVPAVTNALESANRARLIANGTSVYKSVFAQIADVQAELYGGSSVPLPETDTNSDMNFSNSNNYFLYLVADDILSVNWSFFAASNVPSAPGKFEEGNANSYTVFGQRNNAWIVSEDLTVDDSGTPFMITRNLGGDSNANNTTNLTQNGTFIQLDPNLGGNLRDNVGGPPYDDRALVVIRIGGSGEAMRDRNITWQNLNPGRANNPLLQPGDADASGLPPAN